MAEWNNDQVIDDDSIDDDLQSEDQQDGAGIPASNGDYVDQLLRDQSIDDKDSIMFEDENGQLEERKWDDLTDEEKYNILSTPKSIPVRDDSQQLDDAEVQLVNNIRQSGMSPGEYLHAVQNQAVNTFAQNNTQPQFTVDQYNDDELFVADFMSRMGKNVTEQEALEALDRAKQNQTLFAKEIGAIRNEYKIIESEERQQAVIDQQTQAQEAYKQYANGVVDQINNFDNFQGYDLNLNADDKQMLYDFITGTDAAGYNYMAKAFRDPETVVKAAWFLLYGDQAFNDITRYFQGEITNVRRNSYEKGRRASAGGDNKVVYVAKDGKKTESFTDLDDF